MFLAPFSKKSIHNSTTFKSQETPSPSSLPKLSQQTLTKTFQQQRKNSSLKQSSLLTFILKFSVLVLRTIIESVIKIKQWLNISLEVFWISLNYISRYYQTRTENLPISFGVVTNFSALPSNRFNHQPNPITLRLDQYLQNLQIIQRNRTSAYKTIGPLKDNTAASIELPIINTTLNSSNYCDYFENFNIYCNNSNNNCDYQNNQLASKMFDLSDYRRRKTLPAITSPYIGSQQNGTTSSINSISSGISNNNSARINGTNRGSCRWNSITTTSTNAQVPQATSMKDEPTRTSIEQENVHSDLKFHPELSQAQLMLPQLLLQRQEQRLAAHAPQGFQGHRSDEPQGRPEGPGDCGGLQIETETRKMPALTATARREFAQQQHHQQHNQQRQQQQKQQQQQPQKSQHYDLQTPKSFKYPTCTATAATAAAAASITHSPSSSASSLIHLHNHRHQLQQQQQQQRQEFRQQQTRVKSEDQTGFYDNNLNGTQVISRIDRDKQLEVLRKDNDLEAEVVAANQNEGPTILVSKRTLNNLTNQIAFSMNKMKDLEEQVRIIPELQRRLDHVISDSCSSGLSNGYSIQNIHNLTRYTPRESRFIDDNTDDNNSLKDIFNRNSDNASTEDVFKSVHPMLHRHYNSFKQSTHAKLTSTPLNARYIINNNDLHSTNQHHNYNQNFYQNQNHYGSMMNHGHGSNNNGNGGGKNSSSYFSRMCNGNSSLSLQSTPVRTSLDCGCQSFKEHLKYNSISREQRLNNAKYHSNFNTGTSNSTTVSPQPPTSLGQLQQQHLASPSKVDASTNTELSMDDVVTRDEFNSMMANMQKAYSTLSTWIESHSENNTQPELKSANSNVRSKSNSVISDSTSGSISGPKSSSAHEGRDTDSCEGEDEDEEEEEEMDVDDEDEGGEEEEGDNCNTDGNELADGVEDESQCSDDNSQFSSNKGIVDESEIYRSHVSSSNDGEDNIVQQEESEDEVEGATSAESPNGGEPFSLGSSYKDPSDFEEYCAYGESLDRRTKDFMSQSTTIPNDLRFALIRLNDSMKQNRSLNEIESSSNCIEVIKKEWFKVAASKDSQPNTTKLYVDYFESFTKQLLNTVVNLIDSAGNTSMHYAASHYKLDIIKVLLETKVCDVNYRNKAGYTPIMLLALGEIPDNSEEQEIARCLFNIGDVNIKARSSGQTALMLAASHGRVTTCKLLLQCGADPNLQDHDGSTALMCGSEIGNEEVVKCLLAHKLTDPTIVDNDRLDALTIAMSNGHKNVGLLLYAAKNVPRMGRSAMGSSSGASLRQSRGKLATYSVRRVTCWSKI